MAKQFSTNQGITTFGMHLMLDAYGVDPKFLDDMKRVYNFLNSLPDVISMHKLGLPHVLDCDATAGGKDPGGITGVILIAESHITIHTFAKKGFFTMDLYSCNNFEKEINQVLQTTKDYFPFSSHELQVVKRGLKYPSTS